MGLKIGFYRSAAIGDMIVALPALYAIRALYTDCLLVVYTNTLGESLYTHFPFIDKVINMDKLDSSDLVANIDSFGFDYFIMTQPNRWRCKIIGQINAKQILSFFASGSWFRANFKTIFISSSLSRIPHFKRLLLLVRQINPKKYDAHIDTIDFSPITFAPSSYYQAKTQDFLSSLPPHKYVVMINPYTRTAASNLTLEGWLELTRVLARTHKDICFVISSFAGASNFVKTKSLSSRELPAFSEPNIAVFVNNDDLFNLIELIRNMDLLITPSTANFHFAQNLGIPTIALLSKRDSRMWVGANTDKNMCVLLPKSTQQMTPQDESLIIDSVAQKLQAFLDSKRDSPRI